MAEGIVTPDGKPVDIDPAAADQVEQDFARAMSDPDAGNEKAPPKRAAKDNTAKTGSEKPRVRRSPGRPSQASTGSRKAVPAVSRADRVNAVKGLVQVAGVGLMLASKRVKDPVPFQADAVVIASNADPLAEAVADTAANDARFAAIVDKLAAAGPYAALTTVVLGIGVQIARDHGAPIPGTVAPEDIVKAAAEQEMQAA